MASMTIANFADLVELQIRDYIKPQYTSLLTDLQDHPAAKSLLNKNRMDRQGSPEGIFWKADMGTDSSYRHIDATTPDEAFIKNSFVGLTAPWRKVETKYAFIQEEMDFNMGPNQIVDLVKSRERRCDFDFIEGLERDFWGFPSAGDARAFRSLPYWITKNATQGFNGGIPSGYSDVGGISPTTYPRWNNYTFQYTNITIDDLISKLRDMADETSFKPPITGVPDLGAVSGPAKAYYTTRLVRKGFADAADARNENLGPDVATMDSKVMFRNAMIEWVPVLDADTTAPIYQIPWDVFKMFIKSGWWRKYTMLKPYPGQRNQVAVFYDYYFNFVCFNRRMAGVGATGTSYPS